MNNDRLKFRAPYFKNNEFDGFVYFEAGYDCKRPSDHGYLGRREQCTGLKDKNGNLVFECDVVRINGVQESFEVVYAENLCGFGLKHSDGLITSVTPSILGGVEVVANIHKNPELLK